MRSQAVNARQTSSPKPKSEKTDLRAVKKDVQRLERQMAKIEDKVAALHEQMAQHASDYSRIAQLDSELRSLHIEKAVLEDAWLTAMESLGE